MDIKKIIEEWIIASNSFNTEKYLDFYNDHAVLDDPSVGRKYKGKEGIREYFESYFIGYNTHTTIMELEIKDTDRAHLRVEFTGDFPEGTIGGTFDFKFKSHKIESLTADLI